MTLTTVERPARKPGRAQRFVVDAVDRPVAAIYCRLSQDRSGEGLGVERQEQMCRQFASRSGGTSSTS